MYTWYRETIFDAYEKYGYQRVITDRNSVLTYEEIDMLKLADGKSYTGIERDKECCLIVLAGTCSVKGDDFVFENVGQRATPFDGPAEGVYIGRDTAFTVTATGGDVRICVAKAPAVKTISPYKISAADIATKTLGTLSVIKAKSSDPGNLLLIGTTCSFGRISHRLLAADAATFSSATRGIV